MQLKLWNPKEKNPTFNFSVNKRSKLSIYTVSPRYFGEKILTPGEKIM